MRRTLTILGTVIAAAASLAVAGPVAYAEAHATGHDVVEPTLRYLGDGNTYDASALAALRVATNPPVFISNLPGYSGNAIAPCLFDGVEVQWTLSGCTAADLTRIATDLVSSVERASRQNTVTCSYALANWHDGGGTGTGDHTTTDFFTAHVKGADTVFGISTNSKSSTAHADVGVWLRSPRGWPTPSKATVDFRWAGNAYLQADSEFNPITFSGSSATASYSIGAELWAADLSAELRLHATSISAPTGMSRTARPRVRWDDHGNRTPPTLTVPMQPDMEFKSKLIGAMSDSVTPAIGANASAGVDSWSQGNTYLTGSQHWTFTVPPGYTVTDCGGSGDIVP